MNRVNGVGSWFLKEDELQEWSFCQGVPKQATLFCYGDPGVGKTHIRLVRNSLEQVDVTDDQHY